ncbi:hypothetical protein TUM4637_41730 [Shewanella hafniensis]|nr:hypothetical protein TUM4637_41730 [Shewanella hafniensis]
MIKDGFNALNKYIDVERSSVRMNILGMKMQPHTYKEQLVCLCLNDKAKHFKC